MQEVQAEKALGRKFPEQVVLVSSYSPDGRANSMAAGWSMIASGTPLYYAVAIARGHFTVECIEGRGAFVVSFPSTEQSEPMLFCGTKSGRSVDKEAESGFVFRRARLVDAPLIEGAVVNLECRLVHKYEAGDHHIVVGEVVAAHVEAGARRLYNFGDGVFGAAVRAD